MRKTLSQKNYLGFYNELGFKHVFFSPLLFCALFVSVEKTHIKMASETKIREEKEEEALSLVSTKVPKARVRFIRRALRRSRVVFVCFSSLFVSRKRRISIFETLTFVFPVFFFTVCSISREEEMTLSLFFLSLCSLSAEKTFLSAMVMMIVYVVYVSGDQTTDDLSLASVWEMN